MMSMQPDWENRQVVVTGGNGGLGRAVVQHLLDAGARVAITVAHDDPDTPPTHPSLTVHKVDVGDEDQVKAFYAGLGPVWASIHLVGGFDMKPVNKTSQADMNAMLQLNLMTCFLCCREAVNVMGSDGGRIINVAARPALEPTPGLIAYAVSKAAVAQLTRCLAAEVLDRSILINAVAPSIMDTPANRKSMPDGDFDKWPKVEEVAAVIAQLASPANVLTSGAIVPVYGRS